MKGEKEEEYEKGEENEVLKNSRSWRRKDCAPKTSTTKYVPDTPERVNLGCTTTEDAAVDPSLYAFTFGVPSASTQPITASEPIIYGAAVAEDHPTATKPPVFPRTANEMDVEVAVTGFQYT